MIITVPNKHAFVLACSDFKKISSDENETKFFIPKECIQMVIGILAEARKNCE